MFIITVCICLLILLVICLLVQRYDRFNNETFVLISTQTMTCNKVEQKAIGQKGRVYCRAIRFLLKLNKTEFRNGPCLNQVSLSNQTEITFFEFP